MRGQHHLASPWPSLPLGAGALSAWALDIGEGRDESGATPAACVSTQDEYAGETDMTSKIQSEQVFESLRADIAGSGN